MKIYMVKKNRYMHTHYRFFFVCVQKFNFFQTFVKSDSKDINIVLLASYSSKNPEYIYNI